MDPRLMFRLAAPTAALSLLLLAVGVGTAWHVHSMQKNVSSTLLVNVSSMRAAEELEINVHEVRGRLHRFLLTGDRQHLDDIYPRRPEVERWLAEGERWATTEREQALMAQVSGGLAHFFAELDLADQAPPEVRAARVRRLTEVVLPQDVLAPTHAYLDFNEKELERSSQQNRLLAGQVILGLLLLGGCGSAAGLVVGLGLARAVNRSLVELSIPLRAAEGHLDSVIGPIMLQVPAGVASKNSWDLLHLEGVGRRLADRVEAVVDRLRRSEREALRAEQLAAVGQMAAGMAHELRNPLTSMKILVQAAQSRPTRLGARDLNVLEEEITRLEGVIQTFLHYARPPELVLRPAELGRLVEGTVDLVAARAALCDVTLTCDLPEEPCELVVDAGQMRQVLLNLLLNALEATPPGGTVGVVLLDHGAGVVLTVSDDGPGLPADLGARIFAPFVSTKETGLGLGLSICKRIVEGHGGTLEADDAPETRGAGGGAVFRVTLPALVPDEEETPLCRNC